MPLDSEYYRIPTLALLSALVAVFGVLSLQQLTQPGREAAESELPSPRRRQLLWLAGWLFAVVRLAIQISSWGASGVGRVISLASMELAALMFLASLAPQSFSRKPRLSYVVAFGTPVLVFVMLSSLHPEGQMAEGTLLACTGAAFFVALRWSLHRNLLPEWLSLAVVGAVGGICFWLVLRHEYLAALTLVHGGVLLMSALLFASAFRRLTTGMIFTVGGLVGWALPALLSPLQGASLEVTRVVNLMKAIAAVGMIVLVLEDEIASNHASQQRDRRARREMERYTAISLESLPFEEDPGRYPAICATIAAVSRFRQVAMILRGAEGRFRLAGSVGIEGALEGALDALARRTTDDHLEVMRDGKYAQRQIGNLMLVDLSPLMQPGDELEQMKFREVHVLGIHARDRRLLGALILTGLRDPEDPLVAEDVLPLELLAARFGAAREHQLLFRRLMQAERMAGLGQLAGGVAHELNNPLTVVTGYAEMIAESEEGSSQEQAVVILNEARRMKQIIESLMRFRKASPAGRGAVAVDLLLRDIAKLARHDLESARIEVQLRIPEDLPRVLADGEQIRQVFLQVMKNAIGSLGDTALGAERRLMIEAAPSGRAVQVMFSDTGPGFAEPQRAFDPFFTTRHPGEGIGLGLSICYSIVREHGGEISAVNLYPRGAAVVIELPAFLEAPAEPLDGIAPEEGHRGPRVTDRPEAVS